LALELTYQRNFTARHHRALHRRDARAWALHAEQAARWQPQLQRRIPDVQPGDRITGMYRPARAPCSDQRPADRARWPM
jgi:hypothetical protein